jgi:uncharacterized protein YllA (UPF0747 family)
MTSDYEGKKRLLLELKWETRAQLAAIQEEDSERFLQRTEHCDSIIEGIDTFQRQSITFTDSQEREFRELLQEIAEIREQISIRIPSLHEKLRQRAMAEKQTKHVKQRYNNSVYGLPSIFLDKKI